MKKLKKHIEDSEEKIIITKQCRIIMGSDLDVLSLLIDLLNTITEKIEKEFVDEILKSFIEGEFEEFRRINNG